jgi:TonB family protein
MSRFEKKCFVGSAALHGLLLLVFLFGSAFLSSDKTMVLPPVVTLVNANVTDKLIASGGNPQAKPAEPPPSAQPPKIQTPQPPPEPPKEEVKHDLKPKEPDPEPVKPRKAELTKTPEKKRDKTPDKTARKEEKTDPDKSLTSNHVKRTNNLELARQESARISREKAARAEREARARYDAQMREVANQVSGIVSGVRSGISHETVAEVVGPGGAAYVNYTSLIIEKYRAAVYASHPQSDTDAEAMIRVVIARNGTVRSSEWVRRTGNSVLNSAVDRAMKTVHSLPEFPPEAKDSERTFNITIAFEARKVSA